MLSHQATSPFQRKALQILVSLMLLGGWSLALAGSVVDAGTAPQRHSTAHRAQAQSVAPLNTTLPVVASATVLGHPVSLDAPRPTRAGAADPTLAQAVRSDSEHVPSPGFDIRWRESREIVGPDLVSVIRNYRRDGLPVVHLYESGRNMLAIGVNPHGLPGIYFTSHPRG